LGPLALVGEYIGSPRHVQKPEHWDLKIRPVSVRVRVGPRAFLHQGRLRDVGHRLFIDNERESAGKAELDPDQKHTEPVGAQENIGVGADH